MCYLLAAGILTGILLGPFVLGQAAPGWYDRLFSAGEAQVDLDEFNEHEAPRRITDALTSGVSTEYIEQDLNRQIVIERAELTRNRNMARAAALSPRMNAILLAMLALMILELLLAPADDRLAVARYALAATWLALLLACPFPLRQVSYVFVLALIAVAVVVVLVPLGKGAQESTRTQGTEQ